MLSGSDYIHLIESKKAEKLLTTEQLSKLQDKCTRVQSDLYNTSLKLNAEIANKYFKEINHEIPITNRISSAIVLMEHEIKRLEMGMDMPEYDDSELDSALEDLKEQMKVWDTVRRDIACPIKDSPLLQKSIELLHRKIPENFSTLENLTHLQEVDDKFLENADELGECVQAIVQQQEADMEARIQTIHHALKQNARSVMDDLQIEATEMKETMQTERQQHREQLSEMYSSLLDKFLQSSEQSCQKTNSKYHQLFEKQRAVRAGDLTTKVSQTKAAPPGGPSTPAPPRSCHPSSGAGAPPPPPPSGLGLHNSSTSPPPPPMPPRSGPPHSSGPPPPPTPPRFGQSSSAGAPPPPAPARPLTWKSEMDSLYMSALREDQQRRLLEAQLDAALIEELDRSKIEVLDHGMGAEYLDTLMDKLTELYLEASEIDLKRARTQQQQQI